MNYVAPTYNFKIKIEKPRWYEHWYADPRDYSGLICSKNVLQVDDLMKKFRNEVVAKV